MCGIAGIISLDNLQPVAPELIVAMCDEMIHRGPDGEGFLFSSNHREFAGKLKNVRPNAAINVTDAVQSNVLFGHRRLSVIDLSASAAQPMSDASGNYWIVFNGEIYNHKSLRVELEKLKYKFNSDHSDTEVILNCFAAWGIEGIHKLRGMFAFVLWDKIKNTFWIVRDRLGVKPLYYTFQNGIFYFASEIKAILQQRTIPRKINKTALYDYLSFAAVAPPDTLFENIYKMSAGHFIKIENNKISEQKQYWDVFQNVNSIKSNEEEILNSLLTCFRESVNIRRESDVPYGVLLSGGLDSSSNLAMLSDLGKSPVKAFCVGFSNKFPNYKNEFEYARSIAKKFNAEYYEIELEEKHFLDFLPQMVYFQDEPIADTACIPLYYVSKLAKENGVTVVLGGEGSDELLIGYQHWRFAYEFQNFFNFFSGKIVINAAKKILNLPYLNSKRTFYKDWLEKLEKNQIIFWGGMEIRTEKEKQKILTNDFLQSIEGFNSYQTIQKFYKRFLNSGRNNFLDWASYLDLNYRLPELLLARLDKMTMANSVEGRVPFLDHQFVELCMSIQPQMKIKNKEEKYLLKKAMKGILPDEIIFRRKDGFTVPLSDLFQSTLIEFAKESINKFNAEQSVFSEAHLEYIFSQKKMSEVWNILNLSLWWERFK